MAGAMSQVTIAYKSVTLRVFTMIHILCFFECPCNENAIKWIRSRPSTNNETIPFEDELRYELAIWNFVHFVVVPSTWSYKIVRTTPRKSVLNGIMMICDYKIERRKAQKKLAANEVPQGFQLPSLYHIWVNNMFHPKILPNRLRQLWNGKNPKRYSLFSFTCIPSTIH